MINCSHTTLYLMGMIKSVKVAACHKAESVKSEVNMDEELLTPSAAARVVTELGMPKSEGWFRYAAVSGKLPAITTTTGRRLFRRSDLENFVRRAHEGTPPEAA